MNIKLHFITFDPNRSHSIAFRGRTWSIFPDFSVFFFYFGRFWHGPRQHALSLINTDWHACKIYCKFIVPSYIVSVFVGICRYFLEFFILVHSGSFWIVLNFSELFWIDLNRSHFSAFLCLSMFVNAIFYFHLFHIFMYLHVAKLSKIVKNDEKSSNVEQNDFRIHYT